MKRQIEGIERIGDDAYYVSKGQDSKDTATGDRPEVHPHRLRDRRSTPTPDEHPAHSAEALRRDVVRRGSSTGYPDLANLKEDAVGGEHSEYDERSPKPRA
jgi:hypothetical protein